MRKKLVIAGKDLSEFGVVINGDGAYNSAERDLEIISVEGRNGDLIVDKGRYRNVTVPYPISIARNFRDNAAGLRAFLGGLRGYQRIEDSYHPNHFRMGYFTGPVDYAVGHLCRYGEATLKFICKPQRFLISGEMVHIFRAPSKLYNATCEIAKPLITIYGYGTGTLTVGSITVDILALEDHVTLDCESMNAYRKADGGAVENRNSI